MSAWVPTTIRARPLSISARAAAAPLLPVEQHRRDPEPGAEPFDRQEVLLGERLGRRHQRALPPGLDRAQQRVERDHRLARADVALQQPPHRDAAGEVGVDLARAPPPGARSARTGATAR